MYSRKEGGVTSAGASQSITQKHISNETRWKIGLICSRRNLGWTHESIFQLWIRCSSPFRASASTASHVSPLGVYPLAVMSRAQPSTFLWFPHVTEGTCLPITRHAEVSRVMIFFYQWPLWNQVPRFTLCMLGTPSSTHQQAAPLGRDYMHLHGGLSDGMDFSRLVLKPGECASCPCMCPQAQLHVLSAADRPGSPTGRLQFSSAGPLSIPCLHGKSFVTDLASHRRISPLQGPSSALQAF